jgi:phosphohistidine phosphatase
LFESCDSAAEMSGKHSDRIEPQQLYFLRHGMADWPDWDQPDDDRPLTKEGEGEVHEVSKFIRKRGVKPDVVISSPLPRAYQTAKIAAKELGAPLEEDNALSPGCTIEKLQAALKHHREKAIMVVGHEPDFSSMLQSLTGAHLKLSKTGVACVKMEDAHSGKLMWLLTPKFAGC